MAETACCLQHWVFYYYYFFGNADDDDDDVCSDEHVDLLQIWVLVIQASSGHFVTPVAVALSAALTPIGHTVHRLRSSFCTRCRAE